MAGSGRFALLVMVGALAQGAPSSSMAGPAAGGGQAAHTAPAGSTKTPAARRVRPGAPVRRLRSGAKPRVSRRIAGRPLNQRAMRDYLRRVLARARRHSDAPRVSRRIAGQPLTKRATRDYLRRVLARERRFYRPGVSYDARTGLTYDGHAVNLRTGKLSGGPRNWSAASKESLHVILLVKAVAGDPVAQALLTPDPSDPGKAVDAALDVLGRKIDTYRAFDAEHPGYGGFLPWFKVQSGKMQPMADWADRVPGLDNGQLAWSMYLAERILRENGRTELADRYGAHLKLMKDNVVRVFYDPTARQFRGETRMGNGSKVAPGRNRYVNNAGGYFIEDAYEGLMLVHFADLMGSWRGNQAGKQAVWKEPRRKPASMRIGRKKVDVVEGFWFSSHEEWSNLVLPFRDLPVADRLFLNGQRVRTQVSARRGWSGLFASTHRPVARAGEELAYENATGIQEVASAPVRTGAPIFAPDASFPLALVDRQLFASWLNSMTSRPGAFGPYGIGESYSEDGRSAPLLTWDGKALPMVGLMGGVSGDIRRLLKKDGSYNAFMKRVERDYRLFDEATIQGDDVPFHAPPVRATQ